MNLNRTFKPLSTPLTWSQNPVGDTPLSPQELHRMLTMAEMGHVPASAKARRLLRVKVTGVVIAVVESLPKEYGIQRCS